MYDLDTVVSEFADHPAVTPESVTAAQELISLVQKTSTSTPDLNIEFEYDWALLRVNFRVGTKTVYTDVDDEGFVDWEVFLANPVDEFSFVGSEGDYGGHDIGDLRKILE